MLRNISLLFLLLLPALLIAQPMPCGPNAAMTSTCAPACVVCDINGFTGRNNSTVQGQAPPGFCTTVVHHMQWIAFIAGSTNLTLRVDVFGCQQGQGLEIGIYQTSNCNTFSPVSNCNTNAANNNAAFFTNTVPLVIGQYYYFVMDGSANDICNYTVTVVSGTTLVPPLTNSGAIDGPASVCPGTRGSFSSPGQTGATIYNWTLNGAPIGSGLQLEHTFPNTSGDYQLCLTAANACSTAPQTCRTITVPAVPTTQINANICFGDCVTIADTTICQPGTFQRRLTAASGCDSIVRIVLTQEQPVVTNLHLFICEGDTFFVANRPFTQSGVFQEVMTAANTCDSTINLNLTVVICEIRGSITPTSVRCRGSSDGRLEFSVLNGTPPFTYTWQRIGQGAPAGQGSISGLNQAQILPNLPPGQYVVTINDMFGNDVILLADITEPPALSLSLLASDYNGFGIDCAGAATGTLTTSSGGGIPPYNLIWSNGASGQSISMLTAGSYGVTLTDANGCTQTAEALLTQPAPLMLNAAFTNPDCEGPLTGSVLAGATSGGLAPYEYALQNAPFGPDTLFAGLAEGAYQLSLRDANGCISSVSGTLTAAAIPQIELGEDRTLELGESLQLNAVVNIPVTQMQWSPATALSCTDCYDPLATPLRSITYTFSGVSADGCIGVDSVQILVLPFRDVFVPNAFSPNDDGVNDHLAVFGGKEVLKIRTFRVFSRWGELIFEGRDFEPNVPSAGWDGRFKGRPMGQGLYAWVAEIEFIDGVVAVYEGEVTLLR